MNNLFILVTILNLFSINQVLGNNGWFGEKWLNDNYLLKWKTNTIEKSLTVKVEVMTKGWIGFGLSKHGSMKEVDIVIGWVDDQGHPVFNDFWVNESGIRSVDMSQDWHLISAEENATHTILEFYRKYITCDADNDLEIFENEWGLENIVFAYSFIDPINIESIGEPVFQEIFHQNFFQLEKVFEPKEKDVEVFEYWFNHTIPTQPDHAAPQTKVCKLIKMSFTDRRTVIKFRPMIYPTKKDINHHWIVMGCPKSLNESKYENILDKQFPCFDSTNPDHGFARTECNDMMIVTSTLSEAPVILPDEAGITIDPTVYPYFLMEAHLLNNFDHELRVNAVIRMWTTKQSRKYEAQSQSISTTVGYLRSHFGFIMPPKQAMFRISVAVDAYCMEGDEFKKNGVMIFAIMCHSHFAFGHEIRHYRNDKLSRVLRFDHYDSSYQPYQSLKEHINFRKEDKIVITCQFNTMNDTKSYTTPWEHCAMSVYSYPKLEYLLDERVIWSRISYETMLKITGLEQIDNYDNGLMDEIVIRRPVEYNNTKLKDFIVDNRYKISEPQELEELQISADMTECCTIQDRSHLKEKKCKPISKPPGLYKSLIDSRKQNSCPSHELLHKTNNEKTELENTIPWLDSLNKMKLSFKVIMDKFKVSLEYQKF